MGLKEVLLLRAAKRWISGVDLDNAIGDARGANKRGLGALVNYLGEDIKDPATSDAHVEEYLALQGAMSSGGVRGCASVKLTQFGLGSGDRGAAQRLERVVENAERLNQALWIDMEGSATVDSTLAIYTGALAKHRMLGVALQSYMRRSESDLGMLLDVGARIRLVKGAYREAGSVVFSSREEIDMNYARELGMLFERGDNFVVATHDSKLVELARRLAESKRANFEFAMLKGIRDGLKEELVKSGYRVSEYLPYGDSWFAYSRRRLTEHPSNVWLLLRSLV